MHREPDRDTGRRPDLPGGLPEVDPHPEETEPDFDSSPPTDEADWEVFLADEDDDPLPEPGDFWDQPDDDYEAEAA